MDLGSGLYVTVVGMGLVFFSLAVLMIAMMLLDRVFPSRLAAADGSASDVSPQTVASAAPATSTPAATRAGDGPFEAVLGEKKHRVELRDLASQPMVVVVDGREHRVQQNGDPSRLVVDGQAYAAKVVETCSDYVSVRVGDEIYKVAIPASAAVEKAPAAVTTAAPPAATGEATPVLAPLPGRILKVSVGAGATVARGDELLVIEAMKMENSIRAPQDGVVREVRVQQGQSVTPGQVLVVL